MDQQIEDELIDARSSVFRWIRAGLIVVAALVTLDILESQPAEPAISGMLHFGRLAVGLLLIGMITLPAFRERSGIVATCLVPVLLGMQLQPQWTVLSQVPNLFLFALMVLGLNWCFTGWRGHWFWPWPPRLIHRTTEDKGGLGYDSFRLKCLWAMPVLFCVWANLHHGFLAGLGYFVMYLGLRASEALLQRGNEGWGIVRRMVLMIVVAVTATALTPAGPHLHWQLLTSSTLPIADAGGSMASGILTLQTLSFCVMLTGLALSVRLSRRRHDATQLVLLMIALWQAIANGAGPAYFAIMFALWMPPHMGSLLYRLRGFARNVEFPWWRTTRAVGMSAVVLAASTLMLLAQLTSRLSGPTMN